MSYGTMPGTTMDGLTISRPATTVDGEGNPVGTESVVYTGLGSWGTASVKDQQVGAQRGNVIDAVVILANGTDVRDGDVINTRNVNWLVVGVQDVRIHVRVSVKRLGN